jgi:hypothetical protein
MVELFRGAYAEETVERLRLAATVFGAILEDGEGRLERGKLRGRAGSLKNTRTITG